MIMIIGGASSTGSSLLNQLLGRHPRVLISQESSLFARPQLIMDWTRYKKRMLYWNKLNSLKSHGWHRENGLTIPSDTWQTSNQFLSEMIEIEHTYPRFIALLKGHILTKNDVDVWVEKTPANALTMSLLSQVLEGVHFITTIRDPLEAIASMVHRGFDAVYASCVYLLNSSFAMQSTLSNWTLVKYEALILDYKSIVAQLVDTAGLSIDQIDWNLTGEDVKIKGWRYYENRLPQRSEESRFKTLPIVQQRLILMAIQHLKIDPKFHVYGQRPSLLTIKDIAECYGYIVPNSTETEGKNVIRHKLKKAAINRSFRLDPINYFNFPFVR